MESTDVRCVSFHVIETLINSPIATNGNVGDVIYFGPLFEHVQVRLSVIGLEMSENDYPAESSLIPSKTRTQQREKRVPCKNMREQEAILYLNEKRIPDIIDFLMGDLLVHRPYDPFEHLTQLLDRCILSRNGLVDPPPSLSLPLRNMIRQAKQSHR